MLYQETPLTASVLTKLIALSRDWEAENSCYGYRANTREDIEDNRIFAAMEKDEIIAYLFGHLSEAKDMRSILPDHTPIFEVEELYVVPAWRSRGIGSGLFRFAEEAVRADADYILLSTATKNWRAILHFYLEEAGMEFWSARLFKKIR